MKFDLQELFSQESKILLVKMSFKVRPGVISAASRLWALHLRRLLPLRLQQQCFQCEDKDLKKQAFQGLSGSLLTLGKLSGVICRCKHNSQAASSVAGLYIHNQVYRYFLPR